MASLPVLVAFESAHSVRYLQPCGLLLVKSHSAQGFCILWTRGLKPSLRGWALPTARPFVFFSVFHSGFVCLFEQGLVYPRLSWNLLHS